MSFIRSAGCFLFSLLSIFIILYVSAASRFMCVAILNLYFSEYLLISSLTVSIPRSLRISSFLTYQGPFTIVLRILACITSILFIWLIAAVPHSGIPYVQIGFMNVLYIFNLFSMLNLDFRLVSQCICLLVFSTIDLMCSFQVSFWSKWSPRYLTCFVCVICVPFNRMFGGVFFRSVNVIWLHLLGFVRENNAGISHQFFRDRLFSSVRFPFFSFFSRNELKYLFPRQQKWRAIRKSIDYHAFNFSIS